MRIIFVLGVLVIGLSVILGVDRQGRSLAQGGFTVCPPTGGLAMSVWTGASNTPVSQAIVTCVGGALITSVFYFDHLTQGWLFFFTLAPEAA
ncbi:MAG TPA: hypothetical protein VJ256_00335, partial [Dehalococcoidia bacterium]|nr:hypothetical protein [Dehalococcoidia bacterium]